MHLIKTDPDENMFRYYRMEIVPGLFGDWGLVREWGRIGQAGQSRTDWFSCEAEAAAAGQVLRQKKVRRGYH